MGQKSCLGGAGRKIADHRRLEWSSHALRSRRVHVLEGVWRAKAQGSCVEVTGGVYNSRQPEEVYGGPEEGTGGSVEGHEWPGEGPGIY